jgi:hypothetical protein
MGLEVAEKNLHIAKYKKELTISPHFKSNYRTTIEMHSPANITLILPE